MANIKISDLTAASAAADANEYEINEAGTSKKVTGSQLKAYVNAGDGALATKNTVATADIDNLAVTTAKLAADAVDGTKIADDAIDSEHIAAGAIDAEHFASGSVTDAAIASDAVGADELKVTGNGSSGQLLTSDGDGTMTWADAASGGYSFTSTDVVTQSGTWTSPANTSLVKVTAIGGGGGGQSPGRSGGSGGTSAANFGTGKNITSPGGLGGWVGSSFYEAPSGAFNAKPSITGALYIEKGLQTSRASATIHGVDQGSWGFGQSISFPGSIGTAIYEVSPSTGYPITVGGGGGFGSGNTNGNPGGTSGMAGGNFNGNSGNGGNGTAGGGGAPGTGATYNSLNNGKWYAGPGNQLNSGSGGIVIIEY